MLVYGDIERTENASALRHSLAEALSKIDVMTPGLQRHAALVRAFIETGAFVQAIADAEFKERGFDAGSHRQEIGARLLLSIASAIKRSWRDGFHTPVTVLASAGLLLQALDYAGPLDVRRPEGYAFYALYPETYLDAARASGLGSDCRVIGIRSIGTGLAAMVATALGARRPITLRPTGHPFRREISIGPELATELTAITARDFAIVDEGPGLSGSSFAAVADWLESRGVAGRRIHFFPSHSGSPGAQASPENRRRWSHSHRHVVEFDEALVRSPNCEHRLETWIADLIGPLDEPLLNISGGAWRHLRYSGEHLWPPADPRMERRKFLARANGKQWLAKFSGLGAVGERKLHKARMLHRAGFGPEVAGLCHGFLVQRWVDGAALEVEACDKNRLTDSLGRYLGLRAGFDATNGGASLQALFEMARHNTEQALGGDRADQLDRFFGRIGLAGDLSVHRIDSDNRLHVWEWLRLRDGRLMKMDGLDHSSSHDLVGCQDIAWDIAGAAVEHDLSPAELAKLCHLVERQSGRTVERDLVRVMTPCYLAFQMGLWTFAGAANSAEAARTTTAIRRYQLRLTGFLDG
jgi:hypothetical protein